MIRRAITLFALASCAPASMAAIEPTALGSSPDSTQDEFPVIPKDGPQVLETDSGLKYSVLEAGEGGPSPQNDDLVKFHYTGWNSNGDLFDSTRKWGQLMTEQLNELIVLGWREGLALMTVGSKFKFSVPSHLAYGELGRGNVPPNTEVIFVLELVDFESMPKFRKADPDAQQTTPAGLIYEVIEPGEGELATLQDRVELRVAIWSYDGKLLNCSQKKGENVKGRIAEGTDMPFLREAVPLMRTGTRLRMAVMPELFYRAKKYAQANDAAVHVVEAEMVRIFEPLPVPAFSLMDPAKTHVTKTGLRYEVLVDGGSGRKPVMGERVLVHFAGWLPSGQLFDNSFENGEPVEYFLGRQLIEGWNQTLRLMSEGSVYRVMFPGELAYGVMGRRPMIGPNQTLVFYVDLIQILD